MSKTLKHQTKYAYHKWWVDYHNRRYSSPLFFDGYKYWIILPPQVEEECPYPDWIDYEDSSRRSKYYRNSYKKLRHKWTRLLHQNDEWKMGKESLKPENQDYNIW